MAKNKELSQVKKEVLIFGIIVAAVLGAVVGACLIYDKVVQQDMNGERVTYSGCTVTDSSAASVRGAISYFVATTCGTFRTTPEVYERTKIGETYNMETTVGNWANKPTLISVELP